MSNQVIADIYNKIEKLNTGELTISEEIIDTFVADFKNSLLEWATPKKNSGFQLRFSNLGKPARQLWFEKRNPSISLPSPILHIKFLYGHLLEQLILFLVRLSGNTVEDTQKEVTINNIKGHMDCKINGKVVDIKSASKYSFLKFKNGTLREDDPFGYITQLTAYEQADNSSEDSYFLVIDKETGELCAYTPEFMDKPHIESLIDNLTKVVNASEPPDFCYPTIAEGKKGNYKLHKNCTFCPHKKECHKDCNDGKGLRVFNYSKGLMYLTDVQSTPNVEEVYEW